LGPILTYAHYQFIGKEKDMDKESMTNLRRALAFRMEKRAEGNYGNMDALKDLAIGGARQEYEGAAEMGKDVGTAASLLQAGTSPFGRYRQLKGTARGAGAGALVGGGVGALGGAGLGYLGAKSITDSRLARLMAAGVGAGIGGSLGTSAGAIGGAAIGAARKDPVLERMKLMRQIHGRMGQPKVAAESLDKQAYLIGMSDGIRHAASMD
jgi:hypothetical protein